MKRLAIALTLLATTANATAEDRFEGIRQQWQTCAACHGAQGAGGIGPKLAGQDAEQIIQKLMTYKRGETVGPRSVMMWNTAKSLTDGQIGTIGVYVQEGFPKQ